MKAELQFTKTPNSTRTPALPLTQPYKPCAWLTRPYTPGRAKPPVQ